MNYEDLVVKIPEKKLVKNAYAIVSRGLPVWDDYCKHGNLAYTDSIVGMHHTIDAGILKNALQQYQALLIDNRPIAVGKRSHVKGNDEIVYSYLDEPITALGDNDWELPEIVGLYFYSVSNIMNYLNNHWSPALRFEHLQIGTIQGISVLDNAQLLTSSEIVKLLENEY